MYLLGEKVESRVSHYCKTLFIVVYLSISRVYACECATLFFLDISCGETRSSFSSCSGPFVQVMIVYTYMCIEIRAKTVRMLAY